MNLPPPLSWIAPENRHLALAGFGLGTVVLAVVLAVVGKPLGSTIPQAPLRYQFAWNAKRANEIKEIWKPQIKRAQLQLRIDFAFLVFYPLFFSLACAMLAESRFTSMVEIGIFISWAVLASGPLDAIENWALLRMLSHPATDHLARLAGFCSGIKFLLVFSAAGYLILQGLATTIAWCRSS